MPEITIVGGSASGGNIPKSMWTGSANRDDLAALIAKRIHWLDPWNYPVDSIMNAYGRVKERTEEGMEVSYFEDKSLPHTVCVNYAAGYSSSATSIVVDSADSVKPYDILLNHGPTASEQILVTAVNNSTETLTVSRGFGGTAQPINDNAVLINMKSIAVDMSIAGESRITVPTLITQYMAGLRTPWSLSAFYKEWKKYYSENIWNYTKDKNIFEHRKAKELRYFFSMLKKDTSVVAAAASLTNAVGYTFRGAYEWIDTYGESNKVYNVGGNWTEDNFYKNFLEPWQVMKPKKPVIFTGLALLNGIQKWHRDLVRYTTSSKLAGLNMAKVQYPQLGEVTLIHHPLLDAQSEPSGGNTEAVKKGWAFGLDMMNIEMIKGTVSFQHAADVKTFTGTWVGTVPKADNPWSVHEEIADIYSMEMKGSDNHIVANNISGYQ